MKPTERQKYIREEAKAKALQLFNEGVWDFNRLARFHRMQRYAEGKRTIVSAEDNVFTFKGGQHEEK